MGDGGRKRPIRMDGGRKRPTPPKPMDGGRKMPVVRKPIKHRIVGGACKPCKKGTFRGEFDELLQDGACPPCRPMKELKPIKRKIVKLKPIKHRIVGGACKPCKKGTFRGEFNELLQDGACPPCRPMKKLKPI